MVISYYIHCGVFIYLNPFNWGIWNGQRHNTKWLVCHHEPKTSCPYPPVCALFCLFLFVLHATKKRNDVVVLFRLANCTLTQYSQEPNGNISFLFFNSWAVLHCTHDTCTASLSSHPVLSSRFHITGPRVPKDSRLEDSQWHLPQAPDAGEERGGGV